MKKSIHGYKLMLGYIGIFLILLGLINLIPLISLIMYPEDHMYIWNFILPGVISIIIGIGLSFILKNKDLEKFKNHEDMVFVVLVWMVAILTTALPFYLEGYSLTHAIFEATSGLTTTGSSVLITSQLPKIFQFHQAVALLLGGVGLVLVMTSAISDRHGLRLYQAEGHKDKLMSNLAKSAKLIMSMYLGFIFVGSILYMMFGMHAFDAVFYAISAVSTGGFGVHINSIGHFNHLGIEIITMILMLLGATNFLTHVYLFTGKFKKVFHHGVTYVFIGVIILFTTLIAIDIYGSQINMIQANFSDVSYYVRHALFTVISTVTTTGLMTMNGLGFIPGFSILLLILLMLMGGQIGSTSGAIKQDRILIALQSSYWYIRDKMSHKRTMRTNFTLKYNKHEPINDLEIRHNYAFILIYLMILSVGSLLIMSQGFGFEVTLFDMASAMSNTGLSKGVVSASSNNFVLWILTFAMFIGRLEFTIIFIVIIKIIKDIMKMDLRTKEDVT